MCALAFFWPKKIHYKTKNVQFSHFYVNQLLGAGATIYRNSIILHLFADENMKKKIPPEVGYFRKTAEIFSAALTVQSAPKQKSARFKVFIVLGIYNYGYKLRLRGPYLVYLYIEKVFANCHFLCSTRFQPSLGIISFNE